MSTAPAGSADKQQLWQRNQERFASAQQSEPEQPALLEHLDSYIVRQTGWHHGTPAVQAPAEPQSWLSSCHPGSLLHFS